MAQFMFLLWGLWASVLATPQRCRCPELSLDAYFEQADIVVIARIRAVRLVERDGTQRHEVDITPQLRPGPFKGALAGVTLATPVGSASCGVDVDVGSTYIIFASRGDPDDVDLAWFDTCSGSRRYVGGPDAHTMVPFLDVPANMIARRLFELADAPPVQETSAPTFHTSPACWREPRIHHQGVPPSELRSRVRSVRDATPLTAEGGLYSPNQAYRVWLPPPGPMTTGGGGAYMIIDDETPRPLRITFDGAIAPPQVTWINEKLLFVRVVWGRVQFTDLVIDVETGRPIYEEAARYGADAFHQYREACLGQCPCLPVAGSADSLRVPPRHQPQSGEVEALGRLSPDHVGFLDSDWDGRVFAEPAGTRFTVSRAKVEATRDEVPAVVHEARNVDGVYWLHVTLYATSTCVDPEARGVHRGWVPAFSASGRLVAGTWARGC